MNLPHRGLAIYANRGEEEVVIDACTLRIIAGSVPGTFLELVFLWAHQHSTEIQRAVAAVQAGRTPRGFSQAA